MKRLRLLLLLLSLSQLSNGQEFFRMDYNDHWIVKNKDGFSPMVDEVSEHRIIHFYLDLDAHADKKFETCISGEVSLFIDHDIVESKKWYECRIWKVDSLKQLYRKDSILVTVFKVDPDASLKTSLLLPSLGFVPEVDFIKYRSEEVLSGFLIFGLGLLGLVIILIRELNFKYFEEFSNVVKIFSLKVRPSQVYLTKPYALEVFLMVMLISLSMGFSIVALNGFFHQTPFISLKVPRSFWEMVSQWGLMSVVFLVVVYLQFFVLYFINVFFKNRMIVRIQFYDNLRITQFCIGILFLLFVGIFAILPQLLVWFLSQIWVISVGMFIIKGIVIYLKMLNELTHRKLHIFSYFCATEILPVALLVKIIFY